ncbi:MAG: adenylate/guanylate cyclase domain-containing protein [Gemmataceae bacterium]|nr:adenylate/guanylate cyclase domain-containing protein [Gemmataceae bacterium]
MQFYIQTILMVLQLLLMALAGGMVAILAFWMENRQVEEDTNKVLALVSDAITRDTQGLLTQVQQRATDFGLLGQKNLLNVSDASQIVPIFQDLINQNNLVPGMEYIDDKTGHSFHVGRLENKEVFTLEVFFDPVKKGFASRVFLEGDVQRLNPKPAVANPIDPREYVYYKDFRNKGPGWTNVRPRTNNLYRMHEPVFSFVFPLRNPDHSLQGMFIIDMGMKEVGKFLHEQAEKIGIGGTAFAMEKNQKGKIVVIGHDYKGISGEALQLQQGELPEFANFPDSRVQAFGRFLEARMKTGEDPFDMRETGFTRLTDDLGKEWLCAWSNVFPLNAPEWIVVSLAKEDQLYADSWQRLTRFSKALLILFVFSLPLGYGLSRFLTKPMETISIEAEKVGRMDIIPRRLPTHPVIEIQRLRTAIEEMKAGLLSFKKYVPTEVVRRVVQSGKEAIPGGEKRVLTILFTDLAQFTSIAEKLPADQMVALIGDHLAMCSTIVDQHQGTVDKFIGDSVMAFWNAPEDLVDHPLQAAKAALKMQMELAEFNRISQEKGLPVLSMRIGLNTGNVIVGNIGTSERLNYTALGDAVNLASRLEGANKHYGTRILASENTVSGLQGEILCRPVDFMAVKGISQGLLVHELLGLVKDCSADLLKQAELTRNAWELYQARNWSEAANAYGELRAAFPQDELARRMEERSQGFIKNPPGSEWDGTFHATSK